ncbi:MAG: hypothetical protein ACJ739_15740 [Acidimicrobiales bacterium]
MATRSPADAVVALRSMGRRWRGLFAGLAEDESPDALARRPGADGRSALDHAAHATSTLTILDRALEQIVVDDDAVLDSAVADTSRRVGSATGAGVDAAIDELAARAEQLAARADRVASGDWGRRAAVAGDGEVDAITVLWDAVDAAVGDLRAAETTLGEVRGRPV